MSTQQASRYLIKRAIFGSAPVARVSETSRLTATRALPSASRSFHNARGLPAITSSESRRRPTLRPYQQPSGIMRVNGSSPGDRRTIFIQTETTPNPDVSSAVFTHNSPVFRFADDGDKRRRRLSSFFLIIASFLKISLRRS